MVELENIVREKRLDYISFLEAAQELKLKKYYKYYEQCILKFDEILKVLTINKPTYE